MNVERTKHAKLSLAALAGLFVIVFLSVLIGMTVSKLLDRQARQRSEQAEASQTISSEPRLSQATRALLASLEVPVTIRFYAPENINALPEPIRGAALHAANVLNEYESASLGGITVRRIDAARDASSQQLARQDGVVPFNDAEGNVFHLGVAIECKTRREVFGQLSSEWSDVLEADITRAIARVTIPIPAGFIADSVGTPTSGEIDPTIAKQLMEIFPQIKDWKFDDAAKVLREATLEQFKAILDETEAEIVSAQARLSAAKESKSESDSAAAMKSLEKARSDRETKLKQMTATLQERIGVLEKLTASHSVIRAAR